MGTTLRTLVTGGTGTLGRALLPRLQAAGHDIAATSRSPPEGGEIEWREMDLTTGTGIREAVADVDVVIHSASSPLGDTESVDVEGTDRLLDAAADASVSNFVYISIVGIEDIPYSYYQHKLRAEQLIEESGVPWTILRSTQFHAFIHDLLSLVARLPVWLLPTNMKLQPVDEGEVADMLVEHATAEPSGRLEPMGGPEVLRVGELADTFRVVRDTWRPIVPLPLPSKIFSAFRAGAATCPDYDVGTTSWQDWLETEYTEGQPS